MKTHQRPTARVLSRSLHFPLRLLRGIKLLGGEEAEKGERWRGEQTTKLKGLVKAHRWLRATLWRAKALGQTFLKGLGPTCAYRKSVKGFDEIFILTSNVITK